MSNNTPKTPVFDFIETILDEDGRVSSNIDQVDMALNVERDQTLIVVVPVMDDDADTADPDKRPIVAAFDTSAFFSMVTNAIMQYAEYESESARKTAEQVQKMEEAMERFLARAKVEASA